MKKALYFVLSLVIAVACLGGCDTHEHTFAEVWSFDAESHWHAATCEHEEKKDVAEHSFNGNVCSVCGYDKTPPHTHSWTYKYDDEYHWQECSCSERKNREKHTLNGFACTVCDYEAPKPAFTDEMLASVQGPLSLAGTSLFWEMLVGASQRNDLPSSIKTIFTEDTFYQYEINEKEEWELALYKNADGDPVSYLFDPLQNTYEEQRYGKDADQDGTIEEYYTWSKYTNPFDALTADNFIATDTPGEYELGKDVRSSVANTLTGWNDNIASFIVTVEKGAVVSMKFGTEVELKNSDNYGDYFAQSTYSLTVVGRGEAVKPLTVPEPYQAGEEHTKLSAALEQLTNTSFTVKQTDVDDSDIFDEGGLVETHYFTDKAIYVDFTDESGYYFPYGWIDGEEKLIKFEYKDGKASEIVSYDEKETFAEYLPSADFAVALFAQKAGSENVFVARSEAIAAAVTPRLYPIGVFCEYATSLEITLGADGKIAKIVYDYDLMSLPGTVTLEFSNYGETVIPVDLSALTGGDLGGGDIPADLPDDAFGVFETTSADVAITKIELTKTNLTINDTDTVEFRFETDEDGVIVLSFTYNDVEYAGRFTESMFGDPAYWYVETVNDYSYMEMLNKTS